MRATGAEAMPGHLDGIPGHFLPLRVMTDDTDAAVIVSFFQRSYSYSQVCSGTVAVT